jgi:hypothetical protein
VCNDAEIIVAARLLFGSAVSMMAPIEWREQSEMSIASPRQCESMRCHHHRRSIAEIKSLMCAKHRL